MRIRFAFASALLSAGGSSTPADSPPERGGTSRPVDAGRRYVRYLWGLLALAFVVRLLTLGAYPLTDNTEARYAEIARKMVETGDWIVPQIDYGVPFWGKPPLSMWLTALSYELFGVHAFAARLPSLLLTFAVCLLLGRAGVWRGDPEFGLRAAVVCATSLVVLVSAGGVMTDPAMWLGTTLSMLGFWRAWSARSREWGLLFFVGLAVGLLAKGPVATVLTVLPIGAWMLLTGRVREGLQRLPWSGGIVVLGALVVPWYVAAELRSPGFLHYFIVGEHLQRFLVPGWDGDLYGVGHAYPRGTIIGFALLGTLPWSPWLAWHLVRGGMARQFLPWREGDGWTLYLVCWMLAPLAFFTLSRNILPTYVLPGVAAFALLVAQVWSWRPAAERRWPFSAGAVVVPVLCAVLAVAASTVGVPSQWDLVAAHRQSSEANAPLVYFRRRPQSAAFYSQGRADRVEDVAGLRRYLVRIPCAYVVTELRSMTQIPDDLRRQFDEVVRSRSGKYALLHWRPDHTHPVT